MKNNHLGLIQPWQSWSHSSFSYLYIVGHQSNVDGPNLLGFFYFMLQYYLLADLGSHAVIVLSLCIQKWTPQIPMNSWSPNHPVKQWVLVKLCETQSKMTWRWASWLVGKGRPVKMIDKKGSRRYRNTLYTDKRAQRTNLILQKLEKEIHSL